MSTTSELRRLASHIEGDVSTQSDQAHSERRRVFYGEFNEREPAAVVAVANASDVSKAVVFAMESDMSLVVQGGGHSVLGHSTTDGGLILDLSRLKGLDIDADGRNAWAGGGLLAGEYTKATAEHGLVTGFGDTPTVGVTGITLGGGVGFLHRKLGLTLDSVLGAEVVTADGQVRLIDEENDPDLFWAIRGGGGNFGVVTKLHFSLYPLDTVLGGMIILPATPETVANFVEIAENASDDMSAIAGVALAPPLPFLPAEVHGRLILLGVVVHAGPPEIGESEVGQIRKLATPLLDGIENIPYPAIYEEEGGPPNPNAVSGRSFFSDEFSVDDAAAAIDALEVSTAPMSVIQLRVLGGAVARVPAETTAFAHRDRKMIVNVISGFDEVGDRPEHEEWVSATRQRLQHGEGGVYINFHADDSEAAVREAYPGSTWDRLVDVKTKYDQANLFSSNHNIPPIGTESGG
ncbi:MAG TPA: FAD-binding oxidoreductase [Acidimicrobiia bacterium]|nr:FAD-binding oxidoreductase [Acidimicrobiia bacterium]